MSSRFLDAIAGEVEGELNFFQTEISILQLFTSAIFLIFEPNYGEFPLLVL